MRYGTIDDLYFDTAAHMAAAQTQIRNAATGWAGLDPTFPLVCDIHNDHYGGQLLHVAAIGTTAAAVQQVFDFLTAQAVALGAVSPNPPNQQSKVLVQTVGDDGHITGGQFGILSSGASPTWTVSTIAPEARPA